MGAGTGALTSHLVRAGARVVAVELHPGRAQLLRRRFPHITVIAADVRRLPLPGRPFRVAANPPYNITADLLHLLLTAGLDVPRRAFTPPPHVDSAVLQIRRR